MTDISIPASVKWISFNAFRGCDALENVYYAGSKSGWGEIYMDDFGNDALFNATVRYAWDDIGLAVKFSDENGDAVTSLEDIAPDGEREIMPDISIVEPDTFTLTTVNLFLAFYDSDGGMVYLRQWETDVSDIRNIFWVQTIQVPENAVQMKIMTLSDEMIPLRATRELS